MRVLVSFGTKEYTGSLEYLRYTALRVGGFDKVLLFGEGDVEVLNRGEKGFGSYAWKPKVIRKALQICRDGDWVVYMDSTISVEKDFWNQLPPDLTGPAFFRIGDAEKKGYTQQRYTKPQCLMAMQTTQQEQDLFQLNAAVQVYVKGPKSGAFLDEYEKWCNVEAAISDDSAWPNHRHDQSILTLLAHRNRIELFPDPTQYGQSSITLNHHRRLLAPMPTIVVVTPTTGDVMSLERCICSVQKQNVVCLRHLVVCDGTAATVATAPLRQKWMDRVPVVWLDLPFITGHNRWNGHRIYGAAPFLASAAHLQEPAEMIAFLDEDNFYDEGHLENMLKTMVLGNFDAVFSLRKIWEAGEFVCDDNCESLGNFAKGSATKDFFADTSAWLLRHAAAVSTAGCWDVRARDGRKAEADRALTHELITRFRVGGVAAHTLNYTAGSSSLSVKSSFFLHSNNIDRWSFADKPRLYLLHFSRELTRQCVRMLHDNSCSHWLDEWNMNQCRGLLKHFNVIDGFECADHIPEGSTVLIHLCHPHELPAQLLGRKDVTRILYTAESPNKRHCLQWKTDFIQSIADDVLTFWSPLLSGNHPFRVHHQLHQCHFWDVENPHDERQLRSNTGSPGSVCCVLENRPGLEWYDIDGTKLQCLDGLRAVFARQLAEQGLTVTVHGNGWTSNGPWLIGGTKGKMADPQHSVDIMQNHSATLIVENCSAEGYVSEKLYDAIMAGSVPIFFNTHKTTHITPDVFFNLASDDVSGITPDSIREKQRNLLRCRKDILRLTSAQEYAQAVLQVYNKAAPDRLDSHR